MSTDDEFNQMIQSMVSDEPDTPKQNKSESEKAGCKQVCHTVCQQDYCDGWCAPLYIHVFISILQCLAISMMRLHNPITKKYEPAPESVKLRYAAVSIVWNLLVGVVMYYLCKYCHSGWSWFILLLPIILNLLLLVVMVGFVVVTYR